MYILLLLLLSFTKYVQEPPKIDRLGMYVLGVTTPDSLNRNNFTEIEPVLVKGTLALTCDRVRLFIARSKDVNGLSVTNLSLVFYEGKLFQISCDTSDELLSMFRRQYGPGMPASAHGLNLCGIQANKLLKIEGEIWQNSDVVARLVQARGYDSNCQTVSSRRLVITNQRVSAFSSACDLSAVDPFLEAFDQANIGRR